MLAFPANNFNKQEPGTNKEIKQFCAKKNVTFDLFAKVSVKGEDQCPLYKFLTTYPDGDISGKVAWNFQKYLVDRSGRVVAKWAPPTSPTAEKVTATIEKALEQKEG